MDGRYLLSVPTSGLLITTRYNMYVTIIGKITPKSHLLVVGLTNRIQQTFIDITDMTGITSMLGKQSEED